MLNFVISPISFSDEVQRFTASFSPNFKFKICQKYKISHAKIIKYIAVNFFWLVNFKFLTDFKFKFWGEIGH
jgi:hypothetical protein